MIDDSGHKSPNQRRRYVRFELNLHGLIKVINPRKVKITDCMTCMTVNISAGGALIRTPQQISEGKAVELTAIVENKTIRELTGCTGISVFEGSVLRSGPNACAIQFKKRKRTKRNKV
jgi:c-di-GMP-binding flagellar brake protein YcgR